MDKYEYRVKTEQLLEYTEKRQYQKAMEIADTIDWRRVKSASMLNTVSEIYEYCGEYQKSRDILFMAFDRSPGSRKIVYRLGTLALKINDVEEASDCYEEFIKLAPKDPNQFILKYKILKMQGAPLEEQIETLEEFKKAEYIEKWAYELAKLYHEAGMTRECLEECDDLILWFSEGKYVYLAMELKMKYKPLTPLQQEKYDRHMKGITGSVSYEEDEEAEEEENANESAEVQEPAEDQEEAEESSEEPEETEESISTGEPEIAAYTDKIIQETEIQEEAEESIKEQEEPEQIAPKKEHHSAITRVVKGATLEEALASGVAIAAGINKEEKSMAEREEQLRISGQMKIEEILQEWEEKQKINADAIEKQKQEDIERLRKEREEAEKRREADRRAVEEAARKAQEEAARRAQEEAARKAAEEAARKAAEEEARREAEEAARREAEEAARKAAEEEAARKAAEEARKVAEEAARKALEEEAAAKKAAEEEAARKAAEEEAARKAAEEEAARKALEALENKEEKKNVLEEKTQRLPDDIMELVEQLESRVAGNSAISRNSMDVPGVQIEEDEEFEEDNQEIDEADYEPQAIEEDFDEEFEEEEFPAEEEFSAEEFDEEAEEELSAEEFEEEAEEEEFSAEEFEEEAEEEFSAEEFDEKEFDEEGFSEDEFASEEDFDENDFVEEEFAEEEFDEDDFDEDDFEEDEFDEDEFGEDDLEDDFEEDELDEDDLEEESEEEVEEKPSEKKAKKEGPLEIEEPSEEEIQKRIKKSKGGGVPFDTGFVVTGRYDLSATSEIGLKAGLTEEQKKLFSYFVPVRGMSEQIVEVLDNDRRAQRQGTSKTGNILVIGRKGSGKTVLAVDIVKAIQKQRNLKQGKVAIVTGESLNKKELTNIIQKLRGGAIIVEKAGKLNSRTIKELNHLMERKTGEMLFVLEDQRKPLERILTANPEFKKKFTSKLELPIFINDELVTFGQTYAKENGYKLDEMGILALYSRIDVMQREDHAVSVAEVKEIMDEAIAHSQRANVKHLARRVFGKSTDSSDRIILKEEDFKI
ncbi:MAG: hypothetical protein ACI4S2_18665 [Lachnospiraceae bacterium]